jgi:hypothetical protein
LRHNDGATMQKSTNKSRPRPVSAQANRDLLNLYLSKVKQGDTTASRHLLALFCEDLKTGRSVDPGLVAYIHQALTGVVALKDARDARRTNDGKQTSTETQHYRAIVHAMGLAEPQGRPSKHDTNVDVAIEVEEERQAGATLQNAAAVVEERRPGINATNIYSRNRTAARAGANFTKRELEEIERDAESGCEETTPKARSE